MAHFNQLDSMLGSGNIRLSWKLLNVWFNKNTSPTYIIQSNEAAMEGVHDVCFDVTMTVTFWFVLCTLII
jgi:hypothetical protein